MHSSSAARGRAEDDRRSRRVVAAALLAGAVLAGGGAYAAGNWIISLNAGSSGEGQSAGIAGLTITATASPSGTNLLYPGGTGDVAVSITNPNPYPVTITAVQLPTNAVNANGYSDSALTTPVTGCAATTPSGVVWNYSNSTNGSSHPLTSPLTVAANGTLTVTLVNDASMVASAPAACAGAYFSMPSFTGVTATGGAATPTASPATDSWTS